MRERALSVVIPVYNSAQALPLLLPRLETVLQEIAERYEVILVNDGSRDQSGEVIRKAASERPFVRGIELMRNYGQHNALLCGIRHACHEIVITMDDDLQNPPEEIPKLLAKLSEGWDVVYGFPAKESHGFFRDLASQITKISLQKAMGAETARRVSSFRAFRLAIRNAFADYRGAFVSIDVLLSWGTTKFAALPVENPPRKIGASNYTVMKLIAHAMNMLTGFTVLPLQLASVLGLTFALFGVALMIFVVGRYLLLGTSVPGFSFLASVISVFSGVQLFALGIIGEYLARMHFRLMDRPSYTVQSVTPSHQTLSPQS
jgi:glycosyltransferase involved in cell wall biosynthesis